MAQNAGLNVAVYHYARLTGANLQSSANSLAIQEAAYFAICFFSSLKHSDFWATVGSADE